VTRRRSISAENQAFFPDYSGVQEQIANVRFDLSNSFPPPILIRCRILTLLATRVLSKNERVPIVIPEIVSADSTDRLTACGAKVKSTLGRKQLVAFFSRRRDGGVGLDLPQVYSRAGVLLLVW
jgi:hypothetical protein